MASVKIFLFKVVFSVYFKRGACYRHPHSMGVLSQTPVLGWVELNEFFLLRLARRSRCSSIWPLKFELECLPTQNAFRGSGTARHLGPQLHAAGSILAAYACVPDPNCSEPSREGRASVCNRAVERRFRAISADWRYSDFGAVKARFLEMQMATWNRSQTGSFS